MSSPMNRRKLLKQVLSGSAAMAAGMVLPNQVNAALEKQSTQPIVAAKLNGNINHSVCRWCYSDLSLEDLCCLLYTSPSPRDRQKSRMPSSA